MRRTTKGFLAALGSWALLVGFTPAPVSAANPPANKTYFAVLIGLDGPYTPEADCLKFTRTQMCTSEGACGTWTRTESGPVGAFSFEIEINEAGTPVRIAGMARVETRGARDSIAGAALGTVGSQTVNFSFAGRSAKPRKCRRLVSEFDARARPGPQCAGYSDWETSLYVLPYEIGTSYRISQGNCSYPDDEWNSHQAPGPWMYSYDFLMPIGSPVVAARAGTVVWAEEQYPDTVDDQGANSIIIDHGDGTYAGYGHLAQDGAAVEVDDEVTQGQRIGTSGMSGNTDIPHLHFEIAPCPGADLDTCQTLPVNFRNTRANPQGLILGETYRALAD